MTVSPEDAVLLSTPDVMTQDERVVHAWLKSFYPQVKRTFYNCPYDFVIDQRRIEAKVSRRGIVSGKSIWGFNIHRHGSVDESQVDAYIFRLEDVPESKAAIHLILPAPIGAPTVRISLRSLLTRYAKYYNAFENLGAGKPQSNPEIELDVASA